MSALSWLLYRRWLTLNGCNPVVDDIATLGALTRQIEQLSARMTGAQRGAGIARFQARVASDGALALRIGCLP